MAEVLPEATTRPCNECPWRRTSLPGWLGPMTAEQWAALAHSDEPIACHMTIVEDGSWKDAFQCAGAAIYRANVYKKPRDPAVAVLPRDTSQVFARSTEFIQHHKGAYS